eukprot:Nk52_evm22s564 gene=Nk52_evmTU22s564
MSCGMTIRRNSTPPLLLLLPPLLALLLCGPGPGHAQQISAGGAGYAISVDGTDDYVSLGEGPTSAAVKKFTIEFWLEPCPDTNPQQQTFLSLALPVTKSNERLEVGVESGLIRLLFSEGFIGQQAMTVTDGPRHLAVVVTESGSGSGAYSIVQWYRNGTLMETISTLTPKPRVISIPTGGVWNLGVASRPIFGGNRRQRPVCGVLDEIRVWGSARTQQEIVANMYQELVNPTGLASLLSYWRFNTGSGAKVVDDSANNNQNGVLGGGIAFETPTWIPSRFPIKGDFIAARCRPGSSVWIVVRDGVVHTDPVLGEAKTTPDCVSVVSGPAHGTLMDESGTVLSSYPHTIGTGSSKLLYSTVSSSVDWSTVTSDVFKVSLCAGSAGSATPPVEHNVQIAFVGDVGPVSGVGKALSLDGQNDYLAVSDFGALPRGGSFTVEILMRPLSTYNNQCIFGKHKSSGSNIFLLGWWQEAFLIQIYDRGIRLGDKTTSERFVSLTMEEIPSVSNPGSGVNDTRATLFYNGVRIESAILSERVVGDTSGLPWTIGQDFDSGGLISDFLLGELDEVRFWDHVRSDSEILSHSKGPLSGSEAGLYFYVNFDEMDPSDSSRPKVYSTSEGLTASGSSSSSSSIIQAELKFGARIVPGYTSVFDRGSAGVAEIPVANTSTICVPFTDKDDDSATDFITAIVRTDPLPAGEISPASGNVAVIYTPSSSSLSRFTFGDPSSALNPLIQSNPSQLSSLKSVCFNYTAPDVFDETSLTYQVFDYQKGSASSAILMIRSLFPGPRLVSATAGDLDEGDPDYNQGDFIRFEFDADTNQPTGTTTSQISNFLLFSCDLGSSLTGVWESPSVFIVSIVVADATSPALNGSCTAKVHGSNLRDAKGEAFTVTTDAPIRIRGSWGKSTDDSGGLDTVMLIVICVLGLVLLGVLILIRLLLAKRRAESTGQLCLSLSEFGDLRMASNMFDEAKNKSGMIVENVREINKESLKRMQGSAFYKGGEVFFLRHTLLQSTTAKKSQNFFRQRCNLTHRNVLRMNGYVIHDKSIENIVLGSTSVLAFFKSGEEHVSNCHIWGVYESCTNMTLEHVINSPMFLKEVQFVGSICYDISNGMKYLHSLNILHGNLSTVTCFVTQSWTVKVSDFGFHSSVNLFPDDNGAIVDKASIQCNESKADLNDIPIGGSVGRSLDFCGDVYSFGMILKGMMKMLRDPEEPESDNTNAYPAVQKSRRGTKVSGGGLGGGGGRRSNSIMGMLLRLSTGSSSGLQQGGDGGESTILSLYSLASKCTQGSLTDPMISDADYRVSLVSRKEENLRLSRPKFSVISSCLVKILPLLASGTMIEVVLSLFNKRLESLVKQRTKEVIETKARVEEVLHELLPPTIARKLISNESVEPSFYESVTIFFSDIVGFTALSSGSTPFEIVNLLNDMYTLFDHLISTLDVYKVETIGDSYMVVSGLPTKNGQEHVNLIVTMALTMIHHIQHFKVQHRPDHVLQLRTGCHTGSVAAGVVGLKMPRYCLFGDTVNMASRMESTGSPNRLQCSESTAEILRTTYRSDGFDIEERGMVAIKGKGDVKTYFINSKKGLFDSENEKEKGNLKVLTSTELLNSRKATIGQYPLLNSPLRDRVSTFSTSHSAPSSEMPDKVPSITTAMSPGVTSRHSRDLQPQVDIDVLITEAEGMNNE